MPALDVSSVLFCPEFVDYVTVTRRTQTVNEFGEVGTVDSSCVNIPAVITTADPNDLVRGDDGQHQPRTFTIVTVYRLQGPTKTTQPDLVTYLGGKYIISQVLPYTRYGAGMVEARMTSIDYADEALR